MPSPFVQNHGSILLLFPESQQLLINLDDVVLAAAASDGGGGDSPTVLAEKLKEHPDVIDVTVPIQCLVEDNSRLSVYEGSKSHLAGLYDPCPSEEKQLLVKYSYQKALHQVLAKEEEPVKMPKNAHRLSSSGVNSFR